MLVTVMTETVNKISSVMKALLVCVFVFLFSCICLCGCKKKDEEPEYGYIPEFSTFDGICKKINFASGIGDSIFYVGNDFNDNGETEKTMLIRYDIKSGEVTDISGHVFANANYGVSALHAAEDGYIYLSVYDMESFDSYLYILDQTEGKVKKKMDVMDVAPEVGQIHYLCVDKESNIYLSGDDNGITVITPEAELKCSIPMENWVNSMFEAEGDVYLSYYGDMGLVAKRIDLTTRTLETSSIMFKDSYPSLFGKTNNGDLPVGSSDDFSIIDMETGVLDDCFSWIDISINYDDVSYIAEDDNGDIIVIANGFDDDACKSSDAEFIRVRKVPTSEIPEKIEIVYGCLWLNYDYKKSIIEYNKTHPDVHITVKDYCTGDISIDEALKQLNSDVITGKGPDILNIYRLPFKKYAERGLFEDLTGYMEDAGLKYEDYQPNFMDAYSIDGHLFAFAPSITVQATFMRKDNAHGMTGWNVEEYLNYFSDIPVEKIYEYSNRDMVFNNCLYSNIDEFVNWDTGECYFNGPEFINFLNFANRYSESYYFSDMETSTSEKIMTNNIYLYQSYIYSLWDYSMTKNIFNGELVAIGEPSLTRNGNYFVSSGSLALSSQSKHKDEAFEFISLYMKDGFQDQVANNDSRFPVKLSALEKMYARAMEPKIEVKDGVEVEVPYLTYFDANDEVNIYALKQEDIDEFVSLLNSLVENPSDSYPQGVQEIIAEESEPFFNGTKTAEECADIIQNRLRIYVSENM